MIAHVDLTRRSLSSPEVCTARVLLVLGSWLTTRFWHPCLTGDSGAGTIRPASARHRTTESELTTIQRP
jgi:hypothetical protein